MSRRSTSPTATAGPAPAVAGGATLAGGASGAAGAARCPRRTSRSPARPVFPCPAARYPGGQRRLHIQRQGPERAQQQRYRRRAVRLNRVSILQAVGAVQSAHGDVNALTPYGSLFADNSAGVPTQTVLTPQRRRPKYHRDGSPGSALFTVTQSSSPAAPPDAAATETATEFAFRGPTSCTTGRLCGQNGGYLAHMAAPGSASKRRHRPAGHGAAAPARTARP